MNNKIKAVFITIGLFLMVFGISLIPINVILLSAGVILVVCVISAVYLGVLWALDFDG